MQAKPWHVVGFVRIAGEFLQLVQDVATGWLIQGEVFPTAVRGRAAAIGASVDWIANFALIEVFPAWHNAIGLGWVMVCFAVIAVLAMGFVYRWLPETKGLSVEQAVSVFERQAKGRKASA